MDSTAAALVIDGLRTPNSNYFAISSTYTLLVQSNDWMEILPKIKKYFFRDVILINLKETLSLLFKVTEWRLCLERILGPNPSIHFNKSSWLRIILSTASEYLLKAT